MPKYPKNFKDIEYFVPGRKRKIAGSTKAINDFLVIVHADYVLSRLTEVQGGLVSLQPLKMAPKSIKNVNNKSVYPVSLSVSDTMCHAPAKMKKLENLGDTVGIRKVDIPKTQKEHMLQLLESDPTSFLEYASTDSVVTLMYASALYPTDSYSVIPHSL